MIYTDSMIERKLTAELLRLLREYPVVSILGPRQAGKTTLAKMALLDYDYVNLEIPEERELAETDPKAFLGQFKRPVIIDEIQRVPNLLSYIQGIVDEKNKNGLYVITGSHQLELRAALTQSLAGRVGLLHLLPLSLSELKQAGIEFDSFSEMIFKGFLPRIYDQKQRPRTAYSNYYQTYIERDVRQLIHLKDVSLFEKFMKLLAGRVGQVINYSSLSNDIGVDLKTIKNWLSVLEASFLIVKLPPFHNNFGKRAIKSPKYYFIDTGLLSFLLGIQQASQIKRDPLVGSLYENLIVIECLKAQYNQGEVSSLYFYRDANGNEVDVVVDRGRSITLVEIKSSSTFTARFLSGIQRIKSITDHVDQAFVVYNGESKILSDNVSLLNTRDVATLF